MNNFYVYLYLREKMSKHGLAGSPYYVGKGCGLRAFKRNNPCDRQVPKDKSRIIIFRDRLSESEAFLIEKLLIAQYGRIETGTGCLWNRTSGGDGCSRLKGRKGKPKPPRTPEHAEKIAVKNRGRIQSAEEKERRASRLRGRKRPPFSEEWKRKMSEAKLSRPTPFGVGHPKGMPAWNKGTRGIMKPNQTSFKKGLVPWNKKAEA